MEATIKPLNKIYSKLIKKCPSLIKEDLKTKIKDYTAI